MNKQNLAKFAKDVQRTLSKHSPEILTGIGIAGMITTTVLAAKATPKAVRLLADAEYEKDGVLTAQEKVKVCWKCYIPAAVTGTFSIACLIGANSVHARRNAALATVYKLSETALNEYREQVVETIDEKKETTIQEKIDKKHVETNPVSKNEVIMTKKGETLCYDHLSGRYFKSDIEQIKRIENILNKRMLTSMFGYVSLNDFYDELNLDRIDIGDDLGWNVHNTIDIRIGSQIADDGRPCVVVGHNNRPEYDYDRLT